MKSDIRNIPTSALAREGLESKIATSQRGVSLLLVLAILTVLAIIGTSFVYVMRMELTAATNFSDKFRADYVAETGITNATQALLSSMTTEQGELAAYGAETINIDTTASLIKTGQKTQKSSSLLVLLSQITTGTNPKVIITDEESKLNLLVACDTEKYPTRGGLNLTQFLTVRFDHAGFANPSYVAQTVSSELYSAYSAGKLTSPDAVRTVVGDTIYNVIGDYVTIYAATANVDKHRQKKVNINTATATEIYNKLQPTLGYQRAAQLAVNIVDYRDTDNVPTLLTVQGTTYRGIEKVPYINEVMPYSSTPDADGNDGQYIELYNPFDEDIVVDGWRIDGAFGSIDISGTILAKGYFIITDEYEDDVEYDGGTLDGYCFKSNYGVVGSSNLVVNETLSLSKTGDTLRLYDASGNLIDDITYTNTEKNVSWEKNDPRVNQLFTSSGGSPYQKNNVYSPPKGTADETALTEILNYPFTGIGDLGYVCAAVSDKPWVTVSIDTASSGIRFANIIDLLSLSSDDKIIGKININTASADVLMAVPGMTLALSEEIVNYRTINGKFNEITDLAVIPGFCGIVNIDDDGNGIVDDEHEKQILFNQMADWLTVRSNVFTLRATGSISKDKTPVSTSSLLVVIDRSENPVKILYRKRV